MRIVRYLASGGAQPRPSVSWKTSGSPRFRRPGAISAHCSCWTTAASNRRPRRPLSTMIAALCGCWRRVGQPGKILALAANYHLTDARVPVDQDVDTPKVFIKPRTALLGPGDPIPYHGVVSQLIEEIELGVVIGRPGKDIPVERAMEHIFGYTVINDVSARELRFPPERAGQERYEFFDWLNGKWLDGFCPVGPWIVDRGLPARYWQPRPPDGRERRGADFVEHQPDDLQRAADDRLHLPLLHARTRRPDRLRRGARTGRCRRDIPARRRCRRGAPSRASGRYVTRFKAPARK